MPSLKKRLETRLAPDDIALLRKLFVAFLLILLFWGTWAVVRRLVG